MRCTSRCAPSAPRLEALEPRALPSTDLIGPTPVPTSDVADRLFVRFAPDTPDSVIQADLAAVGGRVLQSYPDGPDLVTVSSGAARAAAVGRLERDRAVLYAEPDIAVQAKAAAVYPNNPYFGVEWGLSNANGVSIDAPQAWSVTTGNPATIVAVLDTGIDLSDPAFAGRIWTNPDPSGSDGYPGDVHGWNFVSNTPDVQDDDGHGTHVSGILGATGNNGYGVAGVDWNAQIMPVKVLDASGNGTTDEVVSGIYYAVEHGARVINASWGGGPFSQALDDAIQFAAIHNVVFVTAAGNDGTNSDIVPSYPGSYRLPNEITVAAVDSSGNLASFSDYGPHTVDLAAPGVGIWSTIPGSFAEYSGTSMATPFVSGVVSLLAGIHPDSSATQLVQQVLATTKPLPGLSGKTITGGMVDAAQAVGVPGTGLAVANPTSPTPHIPPATTHVVAHHPAKLPVSPPKKKPVVKPVVRHPVVIPHTKPLQKHSQAAPSRVPVA